MLWLVNLWYRVYKEVILGRLREHLSMKCIIESLIQGGGGEQAGPWWWEIPPFPDVM